VTGVRYVVGLYREKSSANQDVLPWVHVQHPNLLAFHRNILKLYINYHCASAETCIKIWRKLVCVFPFPGISIIIERLVSRIIADTVFRVLSGRQVTLGRISLTMAIAGVFPVRRFLYSTKGNRFGRKKWDFPYRSKEFIFGFCTNVFWSSRKMTIRIFKQQFIFQSR
jgi:hypothetical protein